MGMIRVPHDTRFHFFCLDVNLQATLYVCIFIYIHGCNQVTYYSARILKRLWIRYGAAFRFVWIICDTTRIRYSHDYASKSLL